MTIDQTIQHAKEKFEDFSENLSRDIDGRKAEHEVEKALREERREVKRDMKQATKELDREMKEQEREFKHEMKELNHEKHVDAKIDKHLCRAGVVEDSDD